MIIFLLLHTFIADFLHIPPNTLLLFSPILLFSLLMPVPRGILQGLQSFKSLGINLTLEGLVKCTVGIGLILLGFKVYGAIIGVVLSILFAFLFTYKPLKSYLIRTKEIVVSKDVYSYAFPVFIALLILTSYYTLDVLLVKHYFPEAEAGYYAALSLIGKMIFFATFAIGNVMFPKVAEMHALNKDNEHLLNKSLSFMGLGAVIAIIGYFVFSKLIVSLLFGKDFLSITPLVGWIGIAMAFFSLTYLLSLYNLSINRTKFIYLLAFFLILELTLIFLYHNSLAQIVKILAGLMASLFVLLFAYTKMR
ncbi:MAG: oligosaccharide flippase family protein, partial [Candidatus Nanoarchaeia archaeon]